MAMASLGKLIHFSVSSKKVLTFKDVHRTLSTKWAIHETINSQYKTEYIGRNKNELNFTIHLSVTDGIKNPRKVLHEMHLALSRGTPMRFVVGGESVCNRWVITGISEAWNVVMNNGKLVSATVDLTLMEYD